MPCTPNTIREAVTEALEKAGSEEEKEEIIEWIEAVVALAGGDSKKIKVVRQGFEKIIGKRCSFGEFRFKIMRNKSLVQVLKEFLGEQGIGEFKGSPVSWVGVESHQAEWRYPPLSAAQCIYASLYQAEPGRAHEYMFILLEDVVTRALRGDKRAARLARALFSPPYGLGAKKASSRNRPVTMEDAVKAAEVILSKAPDEVLEKIVRGFRKIKQNIAAGYSELADKKRAGPNRYIYILKPPSLANIDELAELILRSRRRGRG